MIGDPPLTPCPSWCEKRAGHDWEDEWRDGLIRYHTRWRTIDGTREHRVGIEEVEQRTLCGTVRQRRIVLDVEAPTEWTLAQAVAGFNALGEAIGLVNIGQTPEDVDEVC